ncbi:hypothetical protein [Bradyrhizobium sp. NBAIM08]|uniref:hypothetical protein n=1 Tax=Bradyrhizobium sp. NBAIM08 TaxID=2793815 RepID=UPI001CD670E4|nr:hypothetical protein [Bradyrhizobium sp. NBAIM08]MCA1476777.1 hypothetical protein [Bradyrhizobium sp. NBAIM08]
MGGLLIVLLVFVSGLSRASTQQVDNPGLTEPEQWVWTEVLEGRAGNLNQHCGTGDLDPAAGDATWDDTCRAISAAFIKKILVSKPWRDELPRRFLMIGARVKDSLDLTDESVGVSVVLYKSRFDAPVSLPRANFAALLDLSGSLFERGIVANSIRVKSDLFLRSGAVVRGDSLNLVTAHVDGDVSLSGSTLEAGLVADGLQANRILLNRTTVRGGPVRFTNAEVRANLVLRDAMLEPKSAAGSPDESINLDSVKIAKSLDLRGTSVRHGSVWLVRAEINGNIELEGSALAGFIADNAQIGGNLQMRSAILAGVPRIDSSDIKGNIDLSASKLPSLDLVNSNVGGILRLGSDARDAPQWQSNGMLNLNGTRTKVLQDRMSSGRDSCELSDSWPSKLNLQSFSYEQLGAKPGHDLRARDACWYRNWLERDPYFSRQPYQQLARVLETQGDPDRANAVRYAARDRELREAWRKGDFGSVALLSLLKITIGYGIGEYTFRVLWWIGGVALVGMLVLVFSSKARKSKRADWKTPRHFDLIWPIWCFGASLDQLLPIVELNKEFSDFFNDPKRERLDNTQHLYFGVQALIGYLLGLALVAALSGVTQAS